MYEYSFIIIIMIFEYHSNNFSTGYTFCVLEIVSQAAFFIWMKTDQGRIRCDVESSEVFHIIDSINIQLGPNWHPSTTKMSASHLIRDTAIFVVDGCQCGPIWMFILSMIWNTSELSTSHRILPWSVFTHIRKGCLR